MMMNGLDEMMDGRLMDDDGLDLLGVMLTVTLMNEMLMNGLDEMMDGRVDELVAAKDVLGEMRVVAAKLAAVMGVLAEMRTTKQVALMRDETRGGVMEFLARAVVVKPAALLPDRVTSAMLGGMVPARVATLRGESRSPEVTPSSRTGGVTKARNMLGGLMTARQVDVEVNVMTGVREGGLVDNGGTGDVTGGVVMGGLPAAALMRSEMTIGDTDVLDTMMGKLGGTTDEVVATSDLSLDVIMVEPDLMLDEMMLDNLLSEMMMDDGELDMMERCLRMDDGGPTMLDEELMDDGGMDLVDEMMTDGVGEMEDGRVDLLGEVMMDEQNLLDEMLMGGTDEMMDGRMMDRQVEMMDGRLRWPLRRRRPLPRRPRLRPLRLPRRPRRAS